MTDELSGRTLGRYQVLERLGRGGMAEVYRAYQPSLDRFVAIKVIYPHLATDAGLRERFGREARAVAALHHPNIVQVHDFDMQGDMAFMAMEFVSGPTLKAAINSLAQRRRQLPLPVIGQIVGQIADALAYAHEQQVVHRDVKPANVLLRRRQRAEPGVPPAIGEAELDDLLLNLGPSSVVLTDFGVARVVSDSVEHTAAGTILGSPAYMSPEQGRGERAGPGSDIYSLGVVLYELLTGRVPFDADTPFAIVVKHIQTPLPPPRVLRPDLPDDLERVLLKALAKDPADRFLDAGAFGAAVRAACGTPERATLRLGDAPAPALAMPAPAGTTRVIEELQATRLDATPTPATATVTPPAQPPATPRPKRRRLGRWLIGAFVALLVLGLFSVAAFVAGGAFVFRGLGEAGALVVPTEFQAEATAAAERGEPFPYVSERTPLPEAVAEALAASREACAAPGCPGGNASAAVTILDDAIAANPDSAELFAARAQTYLWSDAYSDVDQIAADVEAALELDPNSAAAYLAGGELAAIQSDPEAALEAFTRSIELGPTAAAYVARATLLSNAPDYYEVGSPSLKQVIADTTAALALEPANVQALVLRGNAYTNSGQLDAAYDDYNAALEEQPENYYALMGRANALRYSRDDLEGALADYSIAAEAYPDSPDPHRQRFIILVGRGEYEAARGDADKLVDLAPAEPWVYRNRGFLALVAGRLPAAANDFDQALTIAGQEDLAARYGRGKVLLEQGDAAAALPDLEAAVADVDNLDVEWYTFFQGRRPIFLDLARAYAALDRTDEALVAADRAIAADDDWYMPFLIRGRLRASSDPAAARADLRQALTMVGNGPERAEIERELRRLP